MGVFRSISQKVEALHYGSVQQGTKSLTCLTWFVLAKTRGIVHLLHPTLAPNLTSLQQPRAFSETLAVRRCAVLVYFGCAYTSVGSTWVNLELVDLKIFCNLLRPNCCLLLARRAVKIHTTSLHCTHPTNPQKLQEWGGQRGLLGMVLAKKIQPLQENQRNHQPTDPSQHLKCLCPVKNRFYTNLQFFPVLVFLGRKNDENVCQKGDQENTKSIKILFNILQVLGGNLVSVVCLLLLPRSALSIEVKSFCCVLWPCSNNYKLSRVKNCQIPCEHQRIPHSSGSALQSLCQFSQFSPVPPLPVCFCYNLAGPRNSVEQCGLV